MQIYFEYIAIWVWVDEIIVKNQLLKGSDVYEL